MASDQLGPLGTVTCVAGESFVISDRDGDVHPGGEHGLYVRDTRFLDRLELMVDSQRPRPLSGHTVAADRAVFYGYLPRSDDGADPVLLVTRRRTVEGSLHEDVEIDNRGASPRTVVVELVCGTDFAYIFDVRHRRDLPPVTPETDAGRLRFRRQAGVEQTVLAATDEPEVLGGTMRWVLSLEPRSAARVCVAVDVTDVYGTVGPTRPCGGFEESVRRATSEPTPRVRCSEVRLTRLVRRSVQDLQSLQLQDPEAPEDRFCAAGTPWYLTLFGRDAIWTALMALPFDLDLAAGTLRALARRQGTRLDPDTEEAPGKILHEVRRGSLVHRGDLPPNYYGTVDATPLWIMLLHEAWLWGLPEQQVEALLPNLEAALGWMAASVGPGGDGFLAYRKACDRGLDNQGWKDSHDGIQFADGRLARPPIALVEVQAYAYAAATGGADLLEHFGRDGRPWRDWALQLREGFLRRFWLSDDDGPYLAVAIDGDGTPVDSVASNMGHVLVTGILGSEQARTVARRLAQPQLHSGWGVRTLASSATGFNPLSYHGGSVWPHDTAIAAYGCAIAGDRDAATRLIRGLLAAAPAFDYRLPELFAGIARTPGGLPVPYPAACRPQAWASAAALLLLRACLRPSPAIPDGRLHLSPLWPPLFRRLVVSDLPLGGGAIDVHIDEHDGVTVSKVGTDVNVTVDEELA